MTATTYQEGIYLEVDTALIKVAQEGIYLETKDVIDLDVAQAFAYAEVKEIWLIDTAQAFAYAEIEYIAPPPPETITVAPVAMSKNVPIIFRM